GRIVVGSTRGPDARPVTAEEISEAGAMTVLLRDALKPNLLQTLENTPALVHCGPFGNIATGNSSVVADRIGIHGGEFLVTEAGFGADMGAERFFNIKCRVSGLKPDAAVVVCTVRALKAHSGRHKIVAGKPLPEELLAENPDDVFAGADNLRKQLDNIALHGVVPVVAIRSGAERFFNIKCRVSGLKPDAAVVVCTVRALKAHSGRHKIVAGKPLPEELLAENPDDVFAGADNLRKQLDNIALHGVVPVVAINAFPGDYT